MDVSARRAFNLLKEMAYVRVSGTEDEKKAAQRLLEEVKACGIEGKIEEFTVKSGKVHQAKLVVTAPYVKVGGYVLAMKGTAAMEELAEAKNAVKKLGLKLEEIRDFTIDGATHSVIVLRKIAPTPPQFPRRFAKIKQSPL